MVNTLKDNEIVKHYNTDNHSFFYRKDIGFSARIPLVKLSSGKTWPTKAFPDHYNANHFKILSQKMDLSKNPFWSEDGPELLDICITEKCNRLCSYCYQAATKNGKHMPIELYDEILNQTKKTVSQVAIGGGEVTLHPNFCDILKITKEKYSIIPNYTTNGDWLLDEELFPIEFAEEIMSATKKYCGAVAVSSHGDFNEWHEKAKILASEGVKTNIHFILSESTVEFATEILNKNMIDSSINAIVFLLYKPVGRAGSEDILKSKDKINKFFEAIKTSKTKIGFDACSAPIIVSMTDIDTLTFDTCEGARFSGYVHADGQVKACSFDKSPGIKIQDKPFLDIWKEDLQPFRDILSSCKCDCEHKEDCMGGCPFEKRIVICDMNGRKV